MGALDSIGWKQRVEDSCFVWILEQEVEEKWIHMPSEEVFDKLSTLIYHLSWNRAIASTRRIIKSYLKT